MPEVEWRGTPFAYREAAVHLPDPDYSGGNGIHFSRGDLIRELIYLMERCFGLHC